MKFLAVLGVVSTVVLVGLIAYAVGVGSGLGALNIANPAPNLNPEGANAKQPNKTNEQQRAQADLLVQGPRIGGDHAKVIGSL